MHESAWNRFCEQFACSQLKFWKLHRGFDIRSKLKHCLRNCIVIYDILHFMLYKLKHAVLIPQEFLVSRSISSIFCALFKSISYQEFSKLFQLPILEYFLHLVLQSEWSNNRADVNTQYQAFFDLLTLLYETTAIREDIGKTRAQKLIVNLTRRIRYCYEGSYL